MKGAWLACLIVCSTQPSAAAQKKMDMQQAKRIVAGLQGKSQAHPLENPKSLDDVFAILRLDQVNLFAAGVAFAAKQPGIEAKALHAQIELAWGEALGLLAALNTNLDKRFSASAQRLEGKQLSAAERSKLAQLRNNAAEARKTASALQLLAEEHNAAGASLARQVIAEAPDSYLGYRVAADYYRMQKEWDKFEPLMGKLQQANPKSNGLLFLRGVESYQRFHQPQKAIGFFAAALKNDPQFVRAQAHLMLIQGNIEDTYREYQKLKGINPQHQIVTWLGNSIEAAYRQTQY